MKSIIYPVEKKISATEKGFRLEGQIVSNPDFHQYFKPIKLQLFGTSLKDLKIRQRQFITESHEGISSDIPIGGGNWGYKMNVYNPEGQFIGRMTYNGRILKQDGTEVVAE